MRQRFELTRRRFLALAAAAGGSAAIGAQRLAASPGPEIVAAEPWAGIFRLGEGVWAVVSTPMKSSDWRTGSNGGLVTGSERVLVIDSCASAEGATWVADRALELTERRPTDVLVTHYHGDHSNGLVGYAPGEEPPRLWMTETTRDLIVESDAQRDAPDDPVRANLLATATLLDANRLTELDLGGRVVTFKPRRGHTASDVTVELDDPDVVLCGDLLWNGFFPNYRDTTPTAFAASIRALRRPRRTTYVPGHGPLADDRSVGLCLELVDAVEAAARDAFSRGVPAADAAAAFALPDAVNDWVLFNPRYFEVAIGAWINELAAE